MINNSRFHMRRENVFVLMPSGKTVVLTVPTGLIKAVGFINPTSINLL